MAFEKTGQAGHSPTARVRETVFTVQGKEGHSWAGRLPARTLPRGVAARALLRAAACMAMIGLAIWAAAPALAAPAGFYDHNRIRFWERDYALGLVSGLGHPAHVPAVSQAFTTGSHVAAYRLEGVQIAVDYLTKTRKYHNMAVGICADDNGLPGREVVRLDLVNRAGGGTKEFRPRRVGGGYPVLLPNTTYHILFTAGRGMGYRLDIGTPTMMDGWSLRGNSVNYILRSIYNQRIDRNHPDIAYVPGVSLRTLEFRGDYRVLNREYGDHYWTWGPREGEHEGEVILAGIGFDVTYGWNRMSRPLRVQIDGTAITDETPLFNLPPRPVSATVPAAGDVLDIVFDNVPADGAGRTPPPQRFTVMADGMDVTVSGVAVSASDRRARLSLATTIKQNQRVRVSYTDETDGDDAAVLQSPGGVDGPSFTIYRATNGSTVADPSPKPVSATVPAAGGTIDVVFNHAPDSRAGRTPAAERFTVTADAAPVEVSGVAVSGPDKRVRLTLATTIKLNQRVTVGYRDPTTGDDTAALQAVTGEDAVSFSDYLATNGSTVPNPSPRPASATLLAAGNIVDVVFNLLLDDRAGRRPAPSRFTVKADGEEVEVSDVAVSALDKRVRLTLSSALHTEQAVTVSYTDPTIGDDTAALQAPDGADAASFSDYEVSNESTVPHPDARAPVAESARWSLSIRSRIILTFAHSIDKDNFPPDSAFAVRQGTANLELDGIAATGSDLSNRQIAISMEAALFGDTRTVTVAYSDPTDDDDDNAIQSVNGVDAEDFTIDVSGVVGGRASRGVGPALSVADATVTEGAGATADFVVTLTPAASKKVTVDYATSDGSATEPADYTSTSGTLTFAANETSKTVSVPVLDDTDEDSGETFTLTLSNPTGGNARLVDATATGTILNHEATLSVSHTLAENATPGTAVGVPVTAGDPDGDVLTYALYGEDAGAFAIDAATGQIRTKAGVFYDYEIKSSYQVTVTADDGNGNTGFIDVAIRLTDEEEMLTARFEEAPAAHGLAPFTVRLRFSEPVNINSSTRPHRVVRVTNGRAVRGHARDRERGLRELTGRDLAALWEITIEPSVSGGDVTVAAPATADCTVTHVACTVDGRPLSADAQATVSQGTLPALTVLSTEAPATHDRSPFELRVEFSWPVKAWVKAMRAHALAVTGGEVVEASPVGDAGTTWAFRILPWSNAAVTVALPATADCAAEGAVCTADGRMLSEGVDWDIAPEDPDAVDEIVPELIGAEAAAARLTLLYDEGLDEDSRPGADAFTVTVAGATRALAASEAVSVNNRRVTLTLERRAAPGEAVTVSYAAPAENSLRDLSGNAAAALSARAVTNNTRPFRVRFEGSVPAEHDGITPVQFNLVFSEEPASGYDALTLRTKTLDMRLGSRAIYPRGGTELDPPSMKRWNVEYDFTSRRSDAEIAKNDISISIGPTRNCADKGAVCTEDGLKLSNRISAVIKGPPSLRVADARTQEAAAAAVDFTVRLSRKSSHTVTVDHATADGTAMAGEDYEETSGTLTFEAGETSKTVSVPVLQDSAVEDSESFALTLSNASGAGAYFKDAKAEGAIEDGEPAPRVTGVEIVADASGNGIWTAGETVEARLTFSEAVTVSGGTPRIQATVGENARALRYASGSGSTTLVFSIDITDGSYSEVAVVANSLALYGASIVSQASGIAAELAHDGAVSTEVEDTSEGGTALTAEFVGVPDAHDGSAFTFELRFSEEFPLSWRTLKDHAIGVTGGTLDGVSRVTQGESRAWNVTVTPASGGGDVTVTLAATTDCEATGAICTGANVPLSASVAASVPTAAGTETTPAEPFRVEFKNAPNEHDGSTPVVFEVEFTKKPKADYGYQTMRDHTLKIRQGGQTLNATRARRLNKPHNDRWQVTITPGSKADLTVSVGPEASCSSTGAVCAADDEALSNTASTTIQGPPGLSVADAQVTEAPGATVDFVVTLGRSSGEAVTVNYATSDGTATAGADYTSTSGTLSFAAGDTEKTVSVPVLDDAVDERQETFTLTLSNASGGNAYLLGASATGTIENSDPMPRAWLARFGRTAAVHVLNAVEERLDGGPGESWVRLGGHQIGGVTPNVMETVESLAPEQSLWDEVSSADPAGQDMTLDQLLLGSAFHLISNAEDNPFGPRLSAWGRVATSSFDGDEDRMTLEGTVTTATLGVDGVFKRWLTGVALAYSAGDGSFTQTEAPSGDITSTLTSVHPYVGYALSDRVKLWGMVGYGSGSLELVLAGQDPLRTDIDMTMGALGVRGTVLQTAAGLELAIRSDVLWVNTGSAATPGMVQTDADTNRLRLVLEGSRPFNVGDGGLFTPTLELGLRRDGGDAEEGTGVEIGGRLRYTSPSGLSIEASLRALMAHEASAYREWGASGALRYDPGQAGIGLTASITPTWGMAASGVGRLWSQPDARGLAGAPGVSPSGAARVDAELGYGLRALNGQGLLTPYARASLVEGSEHAWHLGTRLALAESLNLSLEATHRQRLDDAAAQELALLATMPW